MLGETEASLAERVGALQAALESQRSLADHSWVLLAAALVLFMQVGFLLLEAGYSRSKNSINVAQKNVVDFLIAVVVFSLLGFGLMFGPSLAGIVGDPTQLSLFTASEPWTYTFFVFQAVFVGTAATIVSGAVAERMTFPAYLAIAAVISALIYPVFGHWAWGKALVGDNSVWLANAGFIDFAGSSVVHSIGGWVALAGVVLLGPRLGRFDGEGKPQTLAPHSIVLSATGSMILLVGWVGFNGGATLALTPAIGPIITNTMLAAVFGGCVGLFLGRVLDGFWAPARMINGMLGALVGITAGCAVVAPAGAAAIGVIAALLVLTAEDVMLHHFKLDDVVGAVAVHGVGGAVGTLLVAVYAAPEHLAAGSRLAQFIVQAQGVGAAFVWAFGGGLLAFTLIRWSIGLRISPEHERRGLNIAEHGATLGTGVLQEALLQMGQAKNEVTAALDESTGDESAEIAAILNPFIAELQTLVQSVGAELETSDGHLHRAMHDLQSARDKAEAANLAKSQFIANMSHELRPPLNAIIGYSEILLEDAEVEAPGQSCTDIRRIITAAKHLLSLINQILDLAKIEAGPTPWCRRRPA